MSEAQNETAAKLGIDFQAMIPDLAKEISTGLRERAIQSLQYQATEAVREAVKQYVQDKVVPEMQTELLKLDAEIRATFAAAIKASVQALATKLVEDTTKKLGNYEGDQLVRDFLKLLGGSRY